MSLLTSSQDAHEFSSCSCPDFQIQEKCCLKNDQRQQLTRNGILSQSGEFYDIPRDLKVNSIRIVSCSLSIPDAIFHQQLLYFIVQVKL